MREERDRRFTERSGREVWSALERATPAIISALESAGVVGVEYVVGFVHPFSIYVWLVTTTDAERDQMPTKDPFLDEVRRVIGESQFPIEHGSIDGTVVQSQETVDRDYEGSWFYALR